MRLTPIDLFELLKPKLGEKEAKDLLNYVEEKADEVITRKKDSFLTKIDKEEIMKSIYIAGVVQYLALLGSILTIFNLLR